MATATVGVSTALAIDDDAIAMGPLLAPLKLAAGGLSPWWSRLESSASASCGLRDANWLDESNALDKDELDDGADFGDFE